MGRPPCCSDGCDGWVQMACVKCGDGYSGGRSVLQVRIDKLEKTLAESRLECLSLLGQLQDRNELTAEIGSLKVRLKEADKDRTRIGTLLSGEMMKHFRPIEYNYQHDRVLKRIEEIWQAEPGTPEYTELEVLATIVHCYEETTWPIKPPSHAAILEFCKDQGIDVDAYYNITKVKYVVTKVDKDE